MDSVSRRDFARLVAVTGSAAFLPSLRDDIVATPLPPTPVEPDEKFWKEVRARFLLPPGFIFLNAANLCPTSAPVIEALDRNTRLLDADPSFNGRARLQEGREESRRMLARSLGVTAEEIVITRNTSEANNIVSSGVVLGAGDEVVIFADNHPSNLAAWREKAKRFGFSVVEVPVAAAHPGADSYLAAFERAMTPRTKLVAMTHVTNTVGDLLPVAAICALARSRGAMSLVDGAQSFGVFDVRLDQMRPDFYTGSVHKWPCGPKETGLLYVNASVHDRIHPSLVSLYPGAVGISRRLEGFGQRDEAALATLATAIKFQDDIGRAAIETRARDLTDRLVQGLRAIDGVSLWTVPSATTSGTIVVFKPATLNPLRLVETLYARDRIACAPAGGPTRPGVRFSPHFYNTIEEIDRTLGAVRTYVANGLPS